jgi:NAD+ synthetase
MPIVYVNQVGGNDELVFDGNSVVFDKNGNILAQAKDFEEDLLVVDLNESKIENQKSKIVPRSGIASIHAALVLGLRDYTRKCGFKKVVLGLSGGIDSAVVAALAVDALGAENVMGVSLPSRYSSDHSKSDAHILAERLGIPFHTVPIELPHTAMEQALAPLFAGTKEGLAEENIQARLRGNVLMALSNKFGHMLLTTGNKSEVAVGYCTLYGDMCGGLAVISDVPKMMVYDLARYINADWQQRGKTPREGPIPESTITKPPSAELRPNQKDQDSLPPYDILDDIIERYVEQEKSVADIIAEGFAPEVVAKVVRLIDISEYKRKQMAPGLKVTSRAFGFGRRMPIAQGYDPKWNTVRADMEGVQKP